MVIYSKFLRLYFIKIEKNIILSHKEVDANPKIPNDNRCRAGRKREIPISFILQNSALYKSTILSFYSLKIKK